MLDKLIDRYFIKQPRLRRAVTRMLAGDSEKQIDLIGARLTINTVKENGYLRATRLCNSSSLLRDEIVVLINLAALIAPRDTFVDVGANVGVYAVTVARFRALFPSLRIYAFEANPDTYSRLIKSTPPGVSTEQVALSDKAGELEFVEGAVSHVFTTVDHANNYSIAGQTKLVQARRLDECEIEGDSLILKVDVEGQELNVLRGASRLFDEQRIKAVYLDGYKDAAEIESMLRGRGFLLFDGRTLKPTDGNVFSLLAIHSDKHAGIH